MSVRRGHRGRSRSWLGGLVDLVADFLVSLFIR